MKGQIRRARSDVADAWIFTYRTATILSHLSVIEGGAPKRRRDKRRYPLKTPAISTRSSVEPTTWSALAFELTDSIDANSNRALALP